MRDIDIRKKIKYSFLKKYYEDINSRVVEELSVSYGDARVDIAVINGSLHGYEIKSENDTLLRLPHQLTTYMKTFDYITFVVGERHVDLLLEQIPDCCGVIIASYKKSSEGIKLKQLRNPTRNNAVEKYALAQLLWRHEAIQILNNYGITKGLSNRNKVQLWELIADTFDLSELSNLVRSLLKSRVKWKVEI